MNETQAKVNIIMIKYVMLTYSKCTVLFPDTF